MTAMEIKATADLDSLHRAFSAFRETNDQRLDQIERRM